MKEYFSQRKLFILFLLLIVGRLIIVLSSWITLRTSFVVPILLNKPVQSGFIIDFSLFTVRLILALVLDIVGTTKIVHKPESKFQLITRSSLHRLVLAFTVGLILELGVYIFVLNQLADVEYLNILQGILSTASFFWLIINRFNSLWYTFIIALYSLYIIILLYPRQDDGQQPIGNATLILFLRSLFLPV